MSLATAPQHHASLSVPTFNELRTIQTGALVDGDLAFVTADNSVWRLSKSSTASVASGETSGIGYSSESNAATGAGRWFRLGYNGLGGNTIMARLNATDANFWPVGGPTSKLSCTITTSSTRLWVTYSACGVADGACTAATMQLYVNTGGAGLVAVTDANFGLGGGGTTTTFLVTTRFQQSFSRLLTGLTAGVNVVEAYMDGTAGEGECNVAAASTNHHAVLKVTEV